MTNKFLSPKDGNKQLLAIVLLFLAGLAIFSSLALLCAYYFDYRVF